jgi:hypothetical protein
MKYDTVYGHYHKARDGEPSHAQMWDGRNMKREKVTIKGREVIQLTEPLKLYDKRGVTYATFKRNLKKFF